MKIVIIGQRWSPYLKDKVMGGSQKVEANQLILLGGSGHEVHFLTSTDSEVVELPNVTFHSVGYSRASLQPFDNKVRNNKIRDLISSINPEVVINHDSDNSGLNNTLNNLKPCVNFVHSHVGMAGGMSAFGYIRTLYKMAIEGHSIVCVSDSSRREWYQHALKNKKQIVGGFVPDNALDDESTIFTDYFHHAVTWEKPQFIESTNKGYITIGRLIPTKRHHIGLQSTEDLRLFSPPPINELEEEIYQKLIGRYNGEGKVNSTGIPTEELEREISGSKALLIFAQESFGLTAVEANIQGVPVILSHKIDDHPVKEACAPGKEVGSIYVIPYEKSPKNVEVFLSEFVPPGLDERVKIAEKTWEYYNPKASTLRLEKLIEKTLNSYNQVQNNKVKEASVFDMFGG